MVRGLHLPVLFFVPAQVLFPHCASTYFVEAAMNHDQPDQDMPLLEYRTVRGIVTLMSRLTPLAFDRHVQRGFFPRPERLPGRAWRWHTHADLELILDLCRRRHWLRTR